MPSLGQYQPHPDRNQENLFVALLNAAIEDGAFSEKFVAEEIQRKHVRTDVFELLANVRRKS